MKRRSFLCALSIPWAAALAACRSAQPAGPAPTLTAEPAPSERPRNTLRWKTNDVSNFGYDVFRGESETGPFVKVNAQTVPGTLKPGKVQVFEFVDATIDPHKDYWYYVESITLAGARLKFTPTLKAPAKIPAAAEGPATPR